MLTERAASRVGRDLLQRKQPQLAVGVCQLVADVFPDATSAHANLGEAYEADRTRLASRQKSVRELEL